MISGGSLENLLDGSQNIPACLALTATHPFPGFFGRTAERVHAAAETLNKGGAREVYVDGGKAIQSFLRAGLIDEITVCWAPVLIGNGRRLFDTLDDLNLTLRGSHPTDTGMVHTTYQVTPNRQR